MKPGTRGPQQQPPTVAIALFVGLMLAAGFMGLVTVIMPGAAMMLATGLVIVLFFVLQYFVWGRALHNYVVHKENQKQASLRGIDSHLPDEPHV
jgi:hypothetical protein